MPPARNFGATIARDSGLMDARWQATFVSKAPDGNTSRVVQDVLKYAIDREEVAASEGLFTGDETVFELPTLASAWDDTVIAPKEADTIEVDSVVYSVVSVSLITWDTVFRCVCLAEK